MTRKLLRFTLLFMSAIMGWAFGFIKVPYIESNHSFWVGFVGCLGMIGFIIALNWVWNSAWMLKLLEKNNSPTRNAQKQWFIKSNFLISFLGIAILAFGLFTYISNNILKEKLNFITMELNDVKNNTNLEQQRINISLLLDLISKLDSTNLNAYDKNTADKMIDRIAALSSSFKINKEWDMENKVSQPISSERGLLLLALVKTKMDSSYFNKIKDNVSFYGADLRNADFHNLNLSGIDLTKANLDYANLEGINLNNANLNGASLVGVHLNHASLVGTNLISAKLSWAKVNEANLRLAKLGRADLSNSTFLESSLYNASFIQAILCNAVFLEADLSKCIMLATHLSNTNLSKTKLTDSYIHSTNLSDVILHDAIIQENWMVGIKENNNSGVNSMLEKYHIVCDSLSIPDSIICRLSFNTH